VASGGDVTAAPADAGEDGRFAICADPRGAAFRLWQAGRLPGAQYVNGPGAWNFSDLYTDDPERAQRFYAPLFGWAFDDLGFATMIRRPGYGDHLESTVDPEIRQRQADDMAPPNFEDAVGWLAPAGDGPDRWHVTFSVADRDDAAARTEALGGRVLASEDTDWTRAVIVRDPQGAELTLSQFLPPA
jgi:predicted enzyme related to lactoylglutathione lyase